MHVVGKPSLNTEPIQNSSQAEPGVPDPSSLAPRASAVCIEAQPPETAIRRCSTPVVLVLRDLSHPSDAHTILALASGDLAGRARFVVLPKGRADTDALADRFKVVGWPWTGVLYDGLLMESLSGERSPAYMEWWILNQVIAIEWQAKQRERGKTGSDRPVSIN